MNNTHYLEFDSTYRNRNEFPYPSNFVVEISQTGTQGATGSKDPVCDASPIAFWNSSFDNNTASLSVTLTGVDIATGDPSIFYIQTAAGDLRRNSNFYTGASLVLTDASPLAVTSRIVGYKFISTGASDIAQITVSPALPTGFPGVFASGSITNPSNDTSTATVPLLFIPSGSSGDNFYVNYIVQYYNPASATPLASSQSFTITNYDGTTHLATLSGNTAVSWRSTNANFVLRKALPSISGNIVYPVPSAVTTNTIQLSPASSPVNGYYEGSFFRLISPFPLNTAGYSTLQGSYGSERKIGRYITGSGVIVSAVIGTNTFTLTASSSSYTTNFYTGGLLTIDYGLVTQETLLVTSYNGTTHSGTVASNWTLAHVANTAKWTMNTAILASSISLLPAQAPQTENAYEIEAFSRDNWNPFSYTGTMVSSQETVCYEIELINLILPNTLINSGRGGRAIFYPYLYVELQQITASSNVKGVIYSNNPNAYKMLFRAVVNDTTQPVYSPFIKIDGNGMVHTIKFKPNDSFLFAVYTPGGSLFKTETSDYYSPTEPNPLVQISAAFAFRRVK